MEPKTFEIFEYLVFFIFFIIFIFLHFFIPPCFFFSVLLFSFLFFLFTVFFFIFCLLPFFHFSLFSKKKSIFFIVVVHAREGSVSREKVCCICVSFLLSSFSYSLFSLVARHVFVGASILT